MIDLAARVDRIAERSAELRRERETEAEKQRREMRESMPDGYAMLDVIPMSEIIRRFCARVILLESNGRREVNERALRRLGMSDEIDG